MLGHDLVECRLMPGDAHSLPKTTAVREALRSVRHLLRRVNASIRVPAEGLPKPAADIANAAVRQLGAIANDMDEVASGFARRALGGEPPPHPTLHEIAGAGADSAFAAACYAGLKRVLQRAGIKNAFVSELAARRAFRDLMESGVASDAALAGELTIRLLDAKVIRNPVDNQGEDPSAVALVAVMLWLLSDRPAEEDEEALKSAFDVAVGLRADINGAVSRRDTVVLGNLYADFAANI